MKTIKSKIWIGASIDFLAGGLCVYAAMTLGTEKKIPVIWLGDHQERKSGLPLNNPSIVRAKKANHMKDDDLIFGLSYQGVTRVYPRWIMLAHHIVNDTV